MKIFPYWRRKIGPTKIVFKFYSKRSALQYGFNAANRRQFFFGPKGGLGFFRRQKRKDRMQLAVRFKVRHGILYKSKANTRLLSFELRDIRWKTLDTLSFRNDHHKWMKGAYFSINKICLYFEVEKF